MSLKLKLISENPDLFERFEIIEEQDNLKKGNSLYVKGPFIGCNQITKTEDYIIWMILEARLIDTFKRW